jgi:hypothetical protein
LVNSAERTALTELCDGLPGLREECDRQSAHQAQLLEQMVAAARARQPITALRAELLGESQDETVRSSLNRGLPGAGAGRANERQFGCPDGACDRLVTPDPAGPMPYCSLTGDQLVRR